MSESPDITKSWVFVDSDKSSKENLESSPSGVEDLTNTDKDSNESHQDSDTDSISVISESGCSYKTDEEEIVPAKNNSDCSEKEENGDEKQDVQREIVESSQNPLEPISDENIKIEKLIYFATSALAAVIIVGFSVAVQQYFQGKADIDSFTPDLDRQNDFSSFSYCVQSDKQNEFQGNKKGHAKKHYKKKHHFEIDEPESKMLRIEEEVLPAPKHQNKHNKKHWKTEDKTWQNDEKRSKKFGKQIFEEANQDYDKKLEELKIKEEYLLEKEKFLIKKEHDLLKRELKMNGKDNFDKFKYGKENQYSKHKKSEKDKKKGDNWQKDDEIKSKKHDNKKSFAKNDRPKFRDDDKQFKKRNVTGQWYINMHKARNSLRQQEHASDWYFDRAHLRSLKRNKAHWYFQWMVDRERLRAK